MSTQKSPDLEPIFCTAGVTGPEEGGKKEGTALEFQVLGGKFDFCMILVNGERGDPSLFNKPKMGKAVVPKKLLALLYLKLNG